MEMNEKQYQALLDGMKNIEAQLLYSQSKRTEEELLSNTGNRLSFTEKEIMKMPKKVRKYFRIEGHEVHYRERKNDGRYRKSYEVRYAKKPFNNPPISVSATSLEELKEKFIAKLHSYVPNEKGMPTVPKDFDGFALFWFEKFHKRKVAEKTYDHDIKLYNRHIKNKLGTFKVKDVNSVMLQNLLDEFGDRGKTAKDIHSLLKQIFDCAVKHGLLPLNIIGMCFLESYEQEHGTAISIANERKLLNAYAGTEYKLYFAIVLYTGLRPCEYASATIDEQFIKAQNGKRKDGKIEYKRIPITPMLRPYLEGITEIHLPKPRVLNNRFKKILPEHQLYDMRTTFETRLDQCGIDDKYIGLFMGNAIGKNKAKGDTKLKKAYTDIDDPDYLKCLYDEGQKFKY